MNARGPLSTKGIEMYLLNLLFDGETQQRFIKLVFKYVGINREKCPSARQILRVNGVLLSSLVFFIFTWVMLYLLTFSMFLTVAYGVNFMIENL